MLLEKLPIRRHHPENGIRPYQKRSQRRQSIHLSFRMIQGTVEAVGEVAVGNDGDESDGGVYYLAAVERDLPLSDQDWTGGNEPGWDCEE